MGGAGSGTMGRIGTRTVEASRSIDVNRLHREACLDAGGWQWTRDGEVVASTPWSLVKTELDDHFGFPVVAKT